MTQTNNQSANFSKLVRELLKVISSHEGVETPSFYGFDSGIMHLAPYVEEAREGLVDRPPVNSPEIENLSQALQTDEFVISDIWKYALLQTAAEQLGFKFLPNISVAEQIPNIASLDVYDDAQGKLFGDIWDQVLVLRARRNRAAEEDPFAPRLNDLEQVFFDGLKALELAADESFDESSEQLTEQVVDFSLGCLFLACELSTCYVQNGETTWVNDGDEVTKWITTFGNYAGFEYKLGEPFSSFGSWIKDSLYENYAAFFRFYYQIDFEEYRSEEEGIDWEAVAEHYCMANF